MKSKATAAWECSEYPILCSRCLGNNPYLRMTREKFGADCKICLKPYTIFRWKPSKSDRFLQTVVCQTCARLKNVCQSCILDIDYCIPVASRDSLVKVSLNPPQQNANREYFLSTNASRIQRNDTSIFNYQTLLSNEDQYKLDILSQKLNSSSMDHAHTLSCSFYAKGMCNRGDKCPYRHVLEISRPPTLKYYQDKYYGSTADEFITHDEHIPPKSTSGSHLNNLSNGDLSFDLQDKVDDQPDFGSFI